jgi:hypothetical protein
MIEHARAPAGRYPLRGDPIEIDDEIEAGLDLVAIGEPGPIPLMQVARGEAGQEIALANPSENRLCGSELDLATGAISPTRMRLQIFCVSDGAQRGHFGYWTYAVVSQMSNECQGRDELAIFCEMAFESRPHFASLQAPLHSGAPFRENCVAGDIEAQNGNGLKRVALRLDVFRRQPVEAVECGPGRISRDAIRVAIDFAPPLKD